MISLRNARVKLLLVPIFFLWTIEILILCSFAEEINEEGWPIPNLKDLVPYSIQIQRVDGAEKIVERFYTTDGGHIARISGNGKVFAYAVDRDREPPIDYLLMDIKGNGKFTIKLKPHETYMIPEWIFR